MNDERLSGLELSDVQFVPMKPLPEWGYVPIESIAPTVRATLRNGTSFEIADIRIRVRAIGKSDRAVLAEEVTDIPGIYFTVMPKSTARRKFVLNDTGAFVEAPQWPNFEIEIMVEAARIWSSSRIDVD